MWRLELAANEKAEHNGENTEKSRDNNVEYTQETEDGEKTEHSVDTTKDLGKESKFLIY